MQNTMLPNCDARDRIKIRVAGQYLVIYLLAFVLGIMLCSLLDPASLPEIEPYVQMYFTDSFIGCRTLYDYASVVVDAAGPDIRAMLLILTAGFTFFCPLALSLLSTWRGFSLGFTTAYLCTALAEEMITLPHGGLLFLIFLGVNIPVAAALIVLSAEAALFSHAYRAQTGSLPKILRAPFLWHYLFSYLTMFGFVLIIELIDCLLSTILL